MVPFMVGVEEGGGESKASFNSVVEDLPEFLGVPWGLLIPSLLLFRINLASAHLRSVEM